MNTTPDHASIELPESLVRRLREFERRLCFVETMLTVVGGVTGILLTYALLFVSDRIWDTPGWLRLPLTVIGGFAVGGFSCWWARRWWWRRRDACDLARLIQKRHGRLGDRLLGIVELATGQSTAERMSPALCRAAIRQVTAESGQYDFRAAAQTGRSRRLSLPFFVLTGLVIAVCATFPQAGLNTFVRWLRPLSGVDRYTFASIESLPGRLVVPHGEPFEISCRLSAGSLWRPTRAACWFEDQARLEAATIGGVAAFRIPGQVETGDLTLRVGDVRKKIEIVPVLRPELISLAAEIDLPEYLQRPAVNTEIRRGSLSVVEGSRIALVGRTDRGLSSAVLASNAVRDVVTSSRDLEIEGDRFRSPAIAAAASSRYTFTWTDRHGLVGVRPYALRVSTVPDDSPIVECRGVGRAIAILQDEIVEMDVSAGDDFGLESLWVNWTGQGNKDRGLAYCRGTETIARGSPVAQTLQGRFRFSPMTFHVPEESMVMVCAYANDYLPGRRPSCSALHRIYVLSRAQHAKLIQQRLAAVQGRLDELASEEAALLERHKQLAALPNEELASEKVTKRLRKDEKSQLDHAAELKELADIARDLLKEALRNKDIPESALRKWSALMDMVAGLSKNEVPAAAGSLGQSGRSAKDRAKHLAEALKLERDIVEALRAAESDIAKSIEDMMAMSFVNRLLLAASREKQIADALRILYPKCVGMKAEDLAKKERDEMERLSQRQTVNRKDVGYIVDDLIGFYDRTRIDKYKKVHGEMVEEEVTLKLAAVAELIRQNQSGEAMSRAEEWQGKFAAWAEALENKNRRGGGGGGGGGGAGGGDLETLIALMRARRREEGLRDLTRLLEETKEENDTYAADATKLSGMQYDLAEGVAKLARKVSHPKLGELIDVVIAEMMNAGMYLGRPQTDSKTIAIETAVIEMLSNSIRSCQGQCGGAGFALMQAMGGESMAMGMGAGKSGGGSMAGGKGDGATSGSGEDASGGIRKPRRVQKAYGLESGDFPEEFKDILEAYFEARQKI